MKPLRLGVIGGCMTHQTSVPRSALYHRVLAKRLEAEHRVRLDLRVARAFHQPYCDRLGALTEEGPLDAVMLHVRIHLARKSGVIALWKGPQHYRYFMHPFLFRRRGALWSDLEKDGFRSAWGFNRPAPPVPTDVPSGPAEAAAEEDEPFAPFSVRDLPRFFGMVVGLDRWAVEDELHEVRHFLDACRAARAAPIVLGPSPAPYSFLLERVRRIANVRLAPELAAAGVPFLPFHGARDPQGQGILRSDGRLNESGHRLVAAMLHDGLEASGALP